MKTLHEIGREYQTDKHDSNHSYCGLSYLDVYDKYLSDIRNDHVNILEIGVRDGCSHRMWREYFQNGTIFGIDIDPRCKQSQSDRIRVLIGSQSDPNITSQAVEMAGGQFDVILDDGSHVNSLTIASFNLLYPSLKPGGLYIIEDLHCSYLENDLMSGIVSGQWPGMKYNKGVEMVNRRKDMDEFFQTHIRTLDYKEQKNTKYPIEWIHFYAMTVIIKKPKA